MCERPKNAITRDMVHNLRYDKPKFTVAHDMKRTKFWPGARFMVVCENGDLNTAAYCLANIMQEPFEDFPMASVAVHESVRDDFIERVRIRFKQLKPHVVFHPNFERNYNLLKCDGSVKYVVANDEDAPACASPVLVTEGVTHIYFPSGATGMTTLHTFETIPEVGLIFGKETPPFDSISIFDEGIISVYELAPRVKCVKFFVNCIDVSLVPIMEYYSSNTPHVVYKNGYHYETLSMNETWRIIVYPYLASIIRPCCCPAGLCHCHITNSICCEDNLN
ncbi:uncharacterized protein [Drosophila tropicalis]|uniref:uncharacterized protein n=1 Tax=Drosophila tropicalis TaxID=46794 RepID=UPI0035ABF074